MSSGSSALDTRDISYNPFSRLQEKLYISSIFWPKGLVKSKFPPIRALNNGRPSWVFTHILTLSSFPSALKVISSFVKFAFLMSPIKSVGAFGKSACSVAVAAAGTADSVTSTCSGTCANLFSNSLGMGQPPFQLILFASSALSSYSSAKALAAASVLPPTWPSKPCGLFPACFSNICTAKAIADIFLPSVRFPPVSAASFSCKYSFALSAFSINFMSALLASMVLSSIFITLAKRSCLLNRASLCSTLV